MKKEDIEKISEMLDIPIEFIEELVNFKIDYEGDWSDVILYVP